MTVLKTMAGPSQELKTVSLIDGKFTPSQANDVIVSLIDKKINFHKLQVLSKMEGNENDKCTFDNGRLEQLKNHRIKLKEIIQEARRNGQKLKIMSDIKIELID